MEGLNEQVIYIITGIVVVLNQGIGLLREMAKEAFDKKKGNGVPGTLAKLQHTLDKLVESQKAQPPYPSCFYDKQHFDRIKRIEENTEFIKQSQEEQRRMIDRGSFTCKVTEDHIKKLDQL